MNLRSDVCIDDVARILTPQDAAIGKGVIHRFLQPHIRHLKKAVITQGPYSYSGYQLFQEARALPENLDLILALQEETRPDEEYVSPSDALVVALWYARVLDNFLECDPACFEFPYRSAVGLLIAASVVKEYVDEYEDEDELSLVSSADECLDLAEDYFSVALGLFDSFAQRRTFPQVQYYRSEMMHALAKSYLLSHELIVPYTQFHSDHSGDDEERVLHSVPLEKCISTFEELFSEGAFSNRRHVAWALDDFGRALMQAANTEVADKGLAYRVLAKKEFDKERQSC